MFTSSKLFREFASAYRNHKSTTDCFLLHGYCRDVYVEFGSSELDKAGFVVDYGALKDIKRWLDVTFDHATVLQADDPLVPAFRALEKEGVMKLTLIPTVSCEGWAMYIAKYIDMEVQALTKGRAWVNFVEVRENGKNASRYINRVPNEGNQLEPNGSVELDNIHFANLLELAHDMEGVSNDAA